MLYIRRLDMIAPYSDARYETLFAARKAAKEAFPNQPFEIVLASTGMVLRTVRLG